MSVQKIESVVWSGVYIGIRGKNCYQLRLETRAEQSRAAQQDPDDRSASSTIKHANT